MRACLHRDWRTLLLAVTVGALVAGCPPPPAVVDGGDGGPRPSDAGPGPDDDGGVTPEIPRVTLLVGETSRGFADGVGRGARFEGITCMEISPDGAALYVSDTFNGTVRQVDTATGEVVTIGGEALSFSTSDGSGDQVRFTEPRGLGLSPDGSTLWVADGPALRSFTLEDREAITWAGVPGEPDYVDGNAIDARLGFLIHDLAVTDTHVLLSDRSNDQIRRWDIEGEVLDTFAGGGSNSVDGVGTAAGFTGNGGVSRDDQTLYIADTFAHIVRALDLDTGAVTTLAGQPGTAGSNDGDLQTAQLDSPQGVAASGTTLFAAGFDGLLRMVDLDTQTAQTVVGVPGGELPVDGPFAAARLGGTFAPPVLHPDGSRLYYADLAIDSVRVVNLTEQTVTTLAGPVQPEGFIDGPVGDARFGWLYGAVATEDGNTLYLADPGNAAVRVVDLAAGQVTSLTDAAFTSPVGVALDEAAGELFVSDYGAGAVLRVDVESSAVSVVTDQGLVGPWGLALTDDQVFAADFEGHNLYAIARSDGMTTLLAGTGAAGSDDGVGADASFVGPLSLALDGSSETLYVSDYGGHMVRAVDVQTQTVTTVAGQRQEGDDDGTPGRLRGPSGVSLRGGQLFIADTDNHLLRALDLDTGALRTVLGRSGVAASFGPGSGVPADQATLSAPEALAATPTGLLVTVEYAVMHVPWAAIVGASE